MFLIRFLVTCMIPDKPDWVATEIAKVEFARREALNRLSSATTTPPSSATVVSVPAAVDAKLPITSSQQGNKKGLESAVDQCDE